METVELLLAEQMQIKFPDTLQNTFPLKKDQLRIFNRQLFQYFNTVWIT